MASCNRYIIGMGCMAVLFTFLLGVFYTTLNDFPDNGILASTVLDVKEYFVENAGGNQRLSEYCNIDVPSRAKTESYGIPGWELQHLAINIRHGDRSAIHRIPGTSVTTPTFKDENSSYVDIRAKQYLNYFKVFLLSRLPVPGATDSSSKDEEHDLKAALNPRKAFHKSDYTLAAGQLTTRGFMQHVALGEQLKEYYGDFLKGITSSQSVYVRSTNYARTVQSVAGLLIAMLPQILRYKKSKLPIHFYAEERHETMHGLVSRPIVAGASGNISAAEASRAIVSEVPPFCPAALSHAHSESQVFSADPNLMTSLINKLGPQITAKTIGKLADATLPSFCHEQPLPCRVKAKAVDRNTGLFSLRGESSSVLFGSSQSCVTPSDLDQMMGESDREYCAIYSGTEGGSRATRLSIYPFLREVTEHLVLSALHGEAAGHHESVSYGRGPYKTPEKLSIFSGHDSVIAPVLAGLGVYREGLCRWPGYASNIVFELWQPAPPNATTAQVEMPPVLQPASTALRSLKKLFPTVAVPAPGKELSMAGQTHYANSFVRIYFNGIDITQRIPACQEERGRLVEQQSAHLRRIQQAGHSLCSLEALATQVSGLIDPHTTITQACAEL